MAEYLESILGQLFKDSIMSYQGGSLGFMPIQVGSIHNGAERQGQQQKPGGPLHFLNHQMGTRKTVSP